MVWSFTFEKFRYERSRIWFSISQWKRNINFGWMCKSSLEFYNTYSGLLVNVGCIFHWDYHYLQWERHAEFPSHKITCNPVISRKLFTQSHHGDILIPSLIHMCIFESFGILINFLLSRSWGFDVGFGPCCWGVMQGFQILVMQTHQKPTT